MNAVDILFRGSATGAVAAAEETSAAVKGVGTSGAIATGELSKLERGAIAGSGALSGMGRSIAFASAGFLGAAGLIGAVKGAVNESEQLAKATDSARVALQHAGENADQLIPKYQATAKAAAEYGVSEATAMTGLARATLLTGSAVKAQRAYEQALLISKATGKDFNSVLTATSKAQDGSATSLTRYGIMLPKVTAAQDALKATNKNATAAQINAAKAVDANSQALQTSQVIMQRFGGQAAANTSNMDKLRANAANLGATLGGPLLAGLNLAAGGLSTLLGWIQRNKAILEPIAEVIGIVTAAWLAYLAVTEGIPAAIAAVEGAMVALDAVMVANPIGLVVVAIAALVAAFIVAWQHSQRFRDIVIGTWHAIESVARVVWGAIGGIVKGALKVLEDVIRVAMALIHGHWSQAWNAIKTLVSDYLHLIVSIIHGAVSLVAAAALALGKAILNGVKAGGQLMLSFLRSLPHLIVAAIGDLSHLLVNAGTSLITGLINGIKSKIGELGHVASGIGGFIKGLKGPLPKDLILLEPEGQAIMQGLINGIASQFPALAQLVGGIGPSLSSGMVLTPSLAGPAAPRVFAAPGGGQHPAAGAYAGANFYVLAQTERQVKGVLRDFVNDAPKRPVMTVVAR